MLQDIAVILDYKIDFLKIDIIVAMSEKKYL